MCNRRVLEPDIAFAVQVNCARLDLILCFLLPREMSDYYRLEPKPVCLHINITISKLTLFLLNTNTLKGKIPAETSLYDCEWVRLVIAVTIPKTLVGVSVSSIWGVMMQRKERRTYLQNIYIDTDK